jgi:hypothetical protein
MRVYFLFIISLISIELIETQEVGGPTNAPKYDIEVRKAALFATQTIGNFGVNDQTSRKSK